MNSIVEPGMKYEPRPVRGSALAFAAGFFFSLRSSIVLFAVRILGTAPSTGAEINLALNVLLLALICCASFGTVGCSRSSMRSQPTIRWIIAFLTLSVASLMWSETVSVTTSLAYWSGIGADVAIVVLLVRNRDVASVTHSAIKGFVWSTCLLALVAWMMPAQADLRLGDPEFLNANQIGNLCAFSIFLAQYLVRRKDGRWAGVITLLLVTLLRSLSKTTIIAFLLSESVLLIQDRSMRRRTKVLITAAVTLLILLFWGLFEAYFAIYTTTGNQAETLTGRTAIWLYVINAASQHPWSPWIGHGFDSVWKVVPPFGSEQFEARHAENELLQQFYAYGVVGIVLLLGIYGSLYRLIRRHPEHSVRVLFSSLLLYVAVRGLSEAEPFDLLFPLWLVVLIAVLLAGARERDEAPVTAHRAPALPLSPLSGGAIPG